MKGIWRTSVVLLFCLVLVASADRKGKANEEEDSDSEVVETQGSNKGSKRIPERGGQCSCRGLEKQVDQLEFRLDRMIDLWNDFVDKNRNPYDQRQGQGSYPGSRVPPQGGIGGSRGPYMPPDGRLPPRRPGYGGRSVMEDEPSTGARRFRF